MSSLYRPSTRREAQAAMAKLTAAERAAHEEGNLHMLRATIERTLWHLDPHSELAAHLRETTKEIRRHTLAGLLPKPKPKSQQKSLPYSQQEESEEPELPRLSVPRQQSPAREPQKVLTNEGSRYQLRDRQDHVPIIELSSDVSSELSDEPIYDFDHAPDQGESASASDMSTLAKEHQKPSRELPVEETPAEEALTQEMPTHESRKRPAEDDGEDDASPVSKRVKGWLTHITGGYM
ncbi:hypothetical protein H9Q69_011725 [Fusarium xylarioides]|uniref:Uncharacterized protein n=1 Tax=Fusarium xylarioides TaxID=221167 RepID=A0A9P7IR65_9HYPO|nr:hypothetical protein H9Q72_009441 [Fusarium xylarioides]KAG5789221.1 hypothetical protein H9Q69_011725 [Fusarium xylarioides]KAG5808551.1 hypothetical protein H9Q71_006953 [Fusarium xylarioides]KAG5827400.1 hypothetical protein H9Q74_002526 [Fusarium xylarioides]